MIIDKRPLGCSGLQLPALGLGCAPLGELFNKVSEEEAQATLQKAWAMGIRLFDTAPWYGRGMSERRLGLFLGSKNRDEYILSTKVGRLLERPAKAQDLEGTPWIGGDPMVHKFDYTYEGIMRSYEASLTRLRVDRIDLLLIHDLDYTYHSKDELQHYTHQLTRGGGFKALCDLKLQNQIRAIGSGINELETIHRMLDLVDLDFLLVALRYTLTEQESLSQALPVCAQKKLGLIVGGVFNSGITATGIVAGAKYNYRDPTQSETIKIAKIQAICDRYAIPLAAAALRFPLAHPLVSSIVPGAFRPEHINEQLYSVKIPNEFWHALKTASLIRADAPVPNEQQNFMHSLSN